MGRPILEASVIPTSLPPNKDNSVVKAELEVDGVTWNVTCVSMGNPHCVTFGTKGGEGLQVDELNLAEIGPKFEIHDAFPARTNTGMGCSKGGTHGRMVSMVQTVQLCRGGTSLTISKPKTRSVPISTSLHLDSKRLVEDSVASRFLTTDAVNNMNNNAATNSSSWSLP